MLQQYLVLLSLTMFIIFPVLEAKSHAKLIRTVDSRIGIRGQYFKKNGSVTKQITKRYLEDEEEMEIMMEENSADGDDKEDRERENDTTESDGEEDEDDDEEVLLGSGPAPPREIADSETAYKYQRLATELLKQVDDIAGHNIADPTVFDPNSFYLSNVASMSTDDVVWDIDAGARKFSINGTEAIGGLFDSFATRKFAFHQLSHYTVYQDLYDGETSGILVEFRHHGVILEAEGNYQDIFGLVREHFNQDALIDYVFVQRFYTIDRGYSNSA